MIIKAPAEDFLPAYLWKLAIIIPLNLKFLFDTVFFLNVQHLFGWKMLAIICSKVN